MENVKGNKMENVKENKMEKIKVEEKNDNHNFVIYDIKCLVSGYDIADDGKSFQIQSITENEKSIVKNTIRITTDFKVEDVENLMDKVIGVKGANKYSNNSYGADNFRVLEGVKVDLIEGIFETNGRIETPILISKITETKKGVKFHSRVKNGTRTDLFQFGLDNRKPIEFQNFYGKRVKLDGVLVYNIDGKNIYKISKEPKLI